MLSSRLRKETYENRVKILGLTTLETLRLRGDIIEAFKIMKGFEDISWSKFFKMSSTKQLRGHSLKLYKRYRFDSTSENIPSANESSTSGTYCLMSYWNVQLSTTSRKKTRSSPSAQQGIQISRIASFPVYYHLRSSGWRLPQVQVQKSLQMIFTKIGHFQLAPDVITPRKFER